ncbi:MAG: phosphatase PAP2 family protein [Myxococcota bacterium]
MTASRSLLSPPPLGARLRSLWIPKTAVLLGLSVGICVPYFLLQRVQLFPLRSPPVLPLDTAIAFDPVWIWPYVSLALLVPLAPLMATTRDELARYARGLALLCLACFAIFLLFPVEGPRGEAGAPAGLYGWIVARDRPSNSMPSLHAGLTVFSLLFGYRVLGESLVAGRHTAYVVLGSIWALLILFSTLGTKQHWVLDLPPGVLLAALAHGWVWRTVPLGQAERVTLPAR